MKISAPTIADTGFGAPWDVVLSTAVVTVAMYASVLAAIRVAGRRTLAELSAFDALVTIAIGTILGSTAVSDTVSYVEGLAAIGTLLGLQVMVGAVRRRFGPARRIFDFRPITVIRDGRVDLPRGLLGAQLTMDELRSQVRHHGLADIDMVDLAVLEPIGGVSVSGTATTVSDHGQRRNISDVVHDHLRRLQVGDLEGDLRTNYADDVVVLSNDGEYRGHDGARRLAKQTQSYAPADRIASDVLVAGDVALVRWRAAKAGLRGAVAAESFVVRAGRIVAQTVHQDDVSEDRPTHPVDGRRGLGTSE